MYFTGFYAINCNCTEISRPEDLTHKGEKNVNVIEIFRRNVKGFVNKAKLTQNWRQTMINFKNYLNYVCNEITAFQLFWWDNENVKIYQEMHKLIERISTDKKWCSEYTFWIY